MLKRKREGTNRHTDTHTHRQTLWLIDWNGLEADVVKIILDNNNRYNKNNDKDNEDNHIKDGHDKEDNDKGNHQQRQPRQIH